MTTRVRNPLKVLVKTAQHFSDNPEGALTKLHRIEAQEGYLFVMDAVRALECVHAKPLNLSEQFTLLRRPEWVWRAVENSEDVCFGVLDDGQFQPRGVYNPAKAKGKFEFSSNAKTGEIVDNPLKDYIPGRLRNKIYKKGTRYHIVKTGTIIDLILADYDTVDIKRTHGKGYLKSFQAYVVVAGPFYTVDLARTQFQNFV